MRGNAVWYAFVEGKHHKTYRARVGGPRALDECPKSVVQVFYGDSEEEVRAMVRIWLRAGGA